MLKKALSLLVLSMACLMAQAEIRYTLSMPQPHTHYYEVEMQFDSKTKTTEIQMPVWAPGSYLVREFARFVEEVQVTVNGQEVAVRKTDKSTWQFSGTGQVKANYRVYAFELSVRSSFLDSRHAYINGTSVFMLVKGRVKENISLSIRKPDSFKTISTSLEKTNDGRYTAPDYDVFADSPIEIGNHQTFKFQAAGVEHEFAMYGEAYWDEAKLKRDVTKIVEEATKVFGSHPCKYYLFIVHHIPNGGGGLEHLNSTTLQTNPEAYLSESGYRGFLGLVAHEYFHLWNVKRLRPIALGPFDYGQENYTHGLWISEGFTSYYDNLLLRRAGLMTESQMLASVVSDATYLINLPGDRIQSAAESSFDAWIKYYRTTENSQNNSVSYYTKGGYLAFWLDTEILRLTQGKKRLDDVLKNLYERYAIQLKRGFTDKEFEDEVVKVGGESLRSFFKDHVFGTKPIDHVGHFQKLGVQLKNLNEGTQEPYLGAQYRITNGKPVITTIKRDSPAWNDGLNVNDEIIAANKRKITDLNSELPLRFAAGEKVVFSIIREDQLVEIPVNLVANPLIRYTSSTIPNPNDSQKLVYRKFLALP